MKFQLLLLSFSALLYVSNASATTLPPNNLHVFDRVTQQSNISEQQFNQITDQIVAIWKPLAAIHGATLEAVKEWNNSTVNAFADQSGSQWKLHMFGGLARRAEITPDGFALVVCHELGHHFGGYYFYDNTGNNAWASAEGQADYFATQVCARRIWGANYRVNYVYRRLVEVEPIVKDKCDKAWQGNARAQELCYRTAAGGLSLANLLSALGSGPKPQFSTPDKRVVSATVTQHPAAQCRLDTYFNGGLCNKMFALDKIPGRGNPAGQNSASTEKIASETSCFAAAGYTQGYRPYCWFKPIVGQRRLF